jgi:hypothetical protein
MAAKKWSEHAEVMRRKVAQGKALAALSKPKRVRKGRPPFTPTPGRPLTARQREFVAIVARVSAKLGRPPNAVDMAHETGLTRLGARRMLKTCEALGLLQDKPLIISSGQWELTEEGLALLEEE